MPSFVTCSRAWRPGNNVNISSTILCRVANEEIGSSNWTLMLISTPGPMALHPVRDKLAQLVITILQTERMLTSTTTMDVTSLPMHIEQVVSRSCMAISKVCE